MVAGYEVGLRWLSPARGTAVIRNIRIGRESPAGHSRAALMSSSRKSSRRFPPTVCSLMETITEPLANTAGSFARGRAKRDESVAPESDCVPCLNCPSGSVGCCESESRRTTTAPTTMAATTTNVPTTTRSTLLRLVLARLRPIAAGYQCQPDRGQCYHPDRKTSSVPLKARLVRTLVNYDLYDVSKYHHILLDYVKR